MSNQVDGNILSYATGDRSLTMFSEGVSPVLSSGIMNMFVDVGTADQSLNLILNHDLKTTCASIRHALLNKGIFFAPGK